MSTKKTIIAVAPAAAALALLASACGSSPGPGVAHLASAPSTRPATSAGGGTSPEDRQRALLDFARCMRRHGASAFPDPARTANGTFGFTSPAAVRRAVRGHRQALDACRPLLARAGVASPQNVATFVAERRRYATCMRRHGEPDFPDPSPDGMFGGRLKSLDRNAPAYRRADGACRAYRTAAIRALSLG